MDVFVFPDTNTFLQCRDIAELGWAEVFSEEDIHILVSRTVQREIDRLKTDGNKRRSSRARKTSAFFRSIIRASDETFVIRDSKPRVTVGFPDNNSAKELLMRDELDRDYADDRLVAEALSFRDAKGVEVCLLSSDTGVVLTAKHVGLKCEEIPDSWLLEPEPDPREKEIVDLRGRVETLEDRLPRISVSFLDSVDSSPIKSLEIPVCIYETLSEHRLDEIVEHHRKANPKKNFESPEQQALDIATLGVFGNRLPSREQIQKYTHEDYPKYLADVRNYFRGLPEQLAALSRQRSFQISISNEGGRSAEKTVVEIVALGGVLICEKLFEPTSVPKPPVPPEPLRFDFLYADSGTGILARSLIMPHVEGRRDPHTFYRRSRSEDFSDSREFTCEDFRHRIEPEVFLVTIVAPGRGVTSPSLRVRVTAANLPEPYAVFIPVRLTTRQESIEKAVLERGPRTFKFSDRIQAK
jgi:hypothetical protein